MAGGNAGWTGPPDLVLVVDTGDIRSLLGLQPEQVVTLLPFTIFPSARTILEDAAQHRFGHAALRQIQSTNRPETQSGLLDAGLARALGAANRLGLCRQAFQAAHTETNINAFVHLVLFRARRADDRPGDPPPEASGSRLVLHIPDIWALQRAPREELARAQRTTGDAQTRQFLAETESFRFQNQRGSMEEARGEPPAQESPLTRLAEAAANRLALLRAGFWADTSHVHLFVQLVLLRPLPPATPPSSPAPSNFGGPAGDEARPWWWPKAGRSAGP